MLVRGGSKISDPNVRLLVVTPLTRNPTASSRLPAVLKASAPTPRMGLDENPACDGATDPGTSRPRSVKWRPLSGICCTVSAVTTWPTVAVARSMSGTSVRTSTVSATFANGQVKVTHQRAADVDVQRFDALGAKTVRLGRDRVVTVGNREDVVPSFGISANGHVEADRLVPHADDGAGQRVRRTHRTRAPAAPQGSALPQRSTHTARRLWPAFVDGRSGAKQQ